MRRDLWPDRQLIGRLTRLSKPFNINRPSRLGARGAVRVGADMAEFSTVMRKLWPNGDQRVPGLVAGIAASASVVFAKYDITSPLLIAHVMAQISHECGAGHDVVENMNYSAERMTQVWPSRFTSIAAAQPYAGNPRALANKVYNGRMGNRPGSDDGYNFRGRGGSQTTGREGYERVAKATGFDVVNHPELLIDPAYFLECAVSDFVNCGCLPFAKADDLINVTKRLNGGTIGLDSRRAWLTRWKAALGLSPVTFAAGLPVISSPPLAPASPKPIVVPQIKVPAAGTVKPGLAPTFWSRVAALFKPKA